MRSSCRLHLYCTPGDNLHLVLCFTVRGFCAFDTVISSRTKKGTCSPTASASATTTDAATTDGAAAVSAAAFVARDELPMNVARRPMRSLNHIADFRQTKKNRPESRLPVLLNVFVVERSWGDAGRRTGQQTGE